MIGWMLYKDSQTDVRPEAYEVNRFLQEAPKMDIDLRVYKPEDVDLIVTRDDRKSIRVKGKIEKLPSFLLPRMGSGTSYFALAIIRHFERLGVPCFSGSAAIDSVKDKLYTQQILAQSDLPFAKTMLAKYPVDADLVEKQFGFPVVVKTLCGSQGAGVILVENRPQFIDIMNLIHSTRTNADIIMQEFISSSRGTDLRVITVGGKAIACMRRYGKDGSFKANFSLGGKVEKYEISPEVEDLATRASKIFGLEIAGVDLLFGKDHFMICEINSSPGFEGMEKATGLNVPQIILTHIRDTLARLPKPDPE